MSSYRGTGHARVATSHPEAFAVCDRCGFWYNHSALRWQFEYRGNKLSNIRLLVCNACMDLPQNQLRPVIIGPDPLPVKDARPENFGYINAGSPPVTVAQILAEDDNFG